MKRITVTRYEEADPETILVFGIDQDGHRVSFHVRGRLVPKMRRSIDDGVEVVAMLAERDVRVH